MTIQDGTFAAVIRAYLQSPKYDSLSDSTRAQYKYLLGLAAHPRTLGSLSINEIRPKLVQAFLDGLAALPGKQKAAKTVLCAVEKWAIVRDQLPRSIMHGTEVIGTHGGFAPWTDEQIKLAETYAKPHIARIITLASNTGQRGSDIVKMRWSDIEDHEGRTGINVTQKKTGLKIWIPFTRELQAAIATWERRPTFICLKRNGLPWTRNQLSVEWDRDRRGNPNLGALAGCVLHGLRATAVVRLRRAGASHLQIADMVGMSEPMVNRYCRLSDRTQNALAAVHYLDRTNPADKISKVE